MLQPLVRQINKLFEVYFMFFLLIDVNSGIVGGEKRKGGKKMGELSRIAKLDKQEEQLLAAIINSANKSNGSIISAEIPKDLLGFKEVIIEKLQSLGYVREGFSFQGIGKIRCDLSRAGLAYFNE
jgi:hypothetical protein